jgi:hypothetical protein
MMIDRSVGVVIYADTYQEAAEFFYGLVADGKIEESGFSYGGKI